MHKFILMMKCENRLHVKTLGVLILLSSFFFRDAYSQVKPEILNKLSVALKQRTKDLIPGEKKIFFISGKNSDSLRLLLQTKKEIQIVYQNSAIALFAVRADWASLKSVAADKNVIFVDVQRKPKEELALSNLDISTNKINLVHNLFPAYNGAGTTVSIKENHPDTTDIDFKGRYLSTTLSSPVFSTHASNMATIIAGAGNSYYEGKGAAWGATISSADFENLLPEPDAAYQQYDISVQNHSYGTGIENYYGADAAAYDASVIDRPTLLHVFSAGNSGMETDTTGTYKDVTGFANITGSFKMAKNIITVGHLDSVYEVLSPSSRGPSYDGRIKPELVVFAEDGSSGAAAIVSGISLLLQQAYKNLKGQLPAASLIKSILLNSADDIGSKGPDYISGYGNANAFKAMQAIIGGKYFGGSVGNQQTITQSFIVPPGLKQLQITLCWTDPPAMAGAPKALVNDLDLSLSLPSMNQTWLPWVLNNSPHIDSLQQPATPKKDSLNNVEQITIDNPLPGNYDINVYGNTVTGSVQPYNIAYQFDTLNRFQWNYPSATDNLFGNRLNILRWNSTYSDSTGQLAYTVDNGATWIAISDSVPLTKGYFKWAPPDSFATSVLRISTASSDFFSDTFTISKRFDVHVGFNCNDSFLLSWNKMPGVDSYRMFSLGEKYMELLQDVADTFLVLKKMNNPSLYYAVAPLISGRVGVRGYGFNYTLQGTACYIQTFLAELSGNSGLLELQLGTVYGLKSITWQKLSSSGYTSLGTIQPSSATGYLYTDPTLSKGVNQYRVKIEMYNGQVVYSDAAFFYYFGTDTYIAYPNPVAQGQSLTVLSNDPDITQMEVHNTSGMLVMKKQLVNEVNTFSMAGLSKGLYFINIRKDSKPRQVFKIFVY